MAWRIWSFGFPPLGETISSGKGANESRPFVKSDSSYVDNRDINNDLIFTIVTLVFPNDCLTSLFRHFIIVDVFADPASPWVNL